MSEKDASLRPTDVSGSSPTVQQPSEPVEVKYRAYPGRFYVITVTALLTAQQNIAWLTFGPVPDAAKASYGLTDLELLLFPGLA